MSEQPLDFSHLDSDGNARMVNIGHKANQRRRATAEGYIECQPATILALQQKAMPKGDVFTVAKIAGIQAAKATSTLIPLCHTLPLSVVDITFVASEARILITAVAETIGKTGVEMEALTAVSVSALTIYDMCKAVDKNMRIGGIRLVEKVKE